MYFVTRETLPKAIKIRRQLRMLTTKIGDNIPTACQARELVILGNKWDRFGRQTKIEALEELRKEQIK